MTDNYYRFLIIDDDKVNNMVCKAAIKAATGGAAVSTSFTNPFDGLAYVKNELPASLQPSHTILFLDINMPEINGWEWLDKFDAFPESIKSRLSVYILSSSVSPTDIELAVTNKYVKEYLVKPLNKAKLLEILDKNSKSAQQMYVA
jgi:CheY-like chemotaxis protein